MHFGSKTLFLTLLMAVLLQLSLPASAIIPARLLGKADVMDDFTIASFDKAISSQRLDQTELAQRYMERGLAYANLLRFQSAVQDYGQALRLDPNKVEVYLYRGVAQARLENYPRAYEDFATAIRLNPNYLAAILQRAYLYFLNGKYESAGKEFSRYLQKKPGDLYRVLWLYLSERYQRSRQTVVRKYIRGVDLTQWPGAMLELYLGDVPLENLVKALKPQLRSWDKEHRCEAYYYLGQYHLIRGELKQAVAYFQEAVKTRAKSQIEYEFSLIYLNQLRRSGSISTKSQTP